MKCLVCKKTIPNPKMGQLYCGRQCSAIAKSYDGIHKKDYVKIEDYILKKHLKTPKKSPEKKIKLLNETKTNIKRKK